MKRSEYWISELAALADVSPRTIRYYVQEGILPQPEIRGKYAVFTDEDRNRLELVKRLKEAYLPLNRIRELLEALDDRKIVALLAEFDQDPVSALSSLQALPVFNPLTVEYAPALSPEESAGMKENALDYIYQVRDRQQLREAGPSRFQRFSAQPAEDTAPATEQWQHLILAPGLELHIRQPVSSSLQPLIDRILQLAKPD